MPKVTELARVTTRGGAVWRACVSCGLLTARPAELTRCGWCVVPGPAGRGLSR